MLKHQEEVYTREMLLDAQWISWGRYYMRDARDGQPPKYWDDQGNEITMQDTVRRGLFLAQLRGEINGKASENTGSEQGYRKASGGRDSHPRSATRR